MKKQIQDERVIQEARKQNSLGFTILYYGLLLDLLYRQFILQDPISRYWDLALLFFGVTFYLVGKRINSGLFTSSPKSKSTVLLSASVATVVFLATNYWWLEHTFSVELIIGGIIFFVVFNAMQLLMQYISNKKNDEMLDDD